MNSNNRTTLTMILMAAASVVAAMYYYPWPEFAETDAEVGKPLFESYEAKNVRGIDIIEFNSDKGTLDRIKLGRRGEQWVVPSRQNFVASYTDQIGAVINTLNDRVVYDVISENQEDHIKYGVVDPTEFSVEKNVAALGQKLTLTDRNNQAIADIIVGSALKNDTSQRYVRIPGKPRVYIIDFDAKILATEFFYWVSPDLLNLQSQTSGRGRQIQEIVIDNYQISQSEDKGKPERTSIYRASMVPAGGRLNIKSLQVPQGDGWKKLGLTPEQQAKLTNAAPFLVRMVVDDVRRKSDELSESIQFPEDEVDDSVFAKMSGYGFYRVGQEDGEWKFDAANGQVTVTTGDGVKTEIMIGNVGNENSLGSGKLNYFVMINSTVDNEFLTAPKRPPGLENDESDENKNYLRGLEAWKAAVEKARQTARELNAIHADWYYLISQDIVLNMRPEIPIPKILQKAPKKSGGEPSVSQREDSVETASDQSEGDDK